MNFIVSLTAVVATVCLGACAGRAPLSTVPSVDLQRYSGRWHEIARYPNWFQRDCAGSAVAEYTPQPDDGSIRVVNTCPRQDGSLRTIVGRATVVPGSNNARLKVRFFGLFARRLLDYRPGRKELLVGARWAPLPPLPLDSVAGADDEGKPLQGNRRHRRAQGLHGQSHKAYAVFDQLVKTSPVIAAKTIAIFALA